MDASKIRELIECALAANGNSYAPYSHFNVSAAALMDSGKIYTGVNVENASYPCGSCAERNAIAQAVAHGESRLVAVALAGGRDHVFSDYCLPCGMCRQAMREFGDPERIAVIAAKSATDYRIYALARLLPESFGPEALETRR